MMDDVYNLSGRHLSRDEIAYVIKIRCMDYGIDVISVEPKSQIKNSIVEFVCSKCLNPTKRKYGMLEVYKTTECKSCSQKKKEGRFGRKTLTKESLQVIVDEKYKEKDISFIIVEEFVYENNKQVVEIVCNNCARKDKSRIDLLKQCRKSCTCVQLRSKLEKVVADILYKNNIKFEKEFGFSDLRYIQPLRYDFCVIRDESLYLIECDGIQHFYPSFGEESFIRTKITDEIKNNYSKDKNIPLLRIPYYTKASIEDLILEFINS